MSKYRKSRNLKGTYVKIINKASSMHAATRELSVRAQLSQTEQTEEEIAVLRRETATLRRENKHLQWEMEAIRTRLLELESGPAVISVASQTGERISPPPTRTKNPAAEEYDSSRDSERRRGTQRNARPKRVVEEEDMETDYDPFSNNGQGEEAVFRSPLQGVRKRLDTGLSGKAAKMRPRDTAEYRRITEMIGELVDLRARLEENTCTKVSGATSTVVTLSLEQVGPRVSRASTGNTDNITVETGISNKKKKKKSRGNKVGGTGPEVNPARNLEPVGRSLRNIDSDSVSYQPIVCGRRGSAAALPRQQDPTNTWVTVVRRRERSKGLHFC